jgi:hypothetical protein
MLYAYFRANDAWGELFVHCTLDRDREVVILHYHRAWTKWDGLTILPAMAHYHSEVLGTEDPPCTLLLHTNRSRSQIRRRQHSVTKRAKCVLPLRYVQQLFAIPPMATVSTAGLRGKVHLFVQDLENVVEYTFTCHLRQLPTTYWQFVLPHFSSTATDLNASTVQPAVVFPVLQECAIR